MGLFYFIIKMEENLQNIIKTLCSDFDWCDLHDDKFKSICSSVIKSIYKTEIINPKLYVKKGGIFQVLYTFKCNIVETNNYGEWCVQNFIFEIDDKFNVTVNINIKE